MKVGEYVRSVTLCTFMFNLTKVFAGMKFFNPIKKEPQPEYNHLL